MRIKTIHACIILFLTASSAVQGMQLCVFFEETMCIPSLPEELAYTYPSCCSGCNVQTMPVLDAAVSTDKFSIHHIHSVTLFSKVSALHIQPHQYYLLNPDDIHSTGPPLFIVHSTFRI
jgi:hypothetical protein